MLCGEIRIRARWRQLFGIDALPFLLGDFQCHLPINPRLNEVYSDRGEVLYIRENRLLDGELLDFGDTELQFSDLAPPYVSVQLQRGSLSGR